MTTLVTQQHQRYVFIDALRGLAALAVVIHHLLAPGLFTTTFDKILPSFLMAASFYARTGVQIFFVLSGFVIAHSLRDNPLTFKSIGNFILRRQIRLDPPYWCVLIIALLLHRVELAMPTVDTQPMPNMATILTNVFYLQNLLEARPIVWVAWTLCIEIQFYLAFVLILVSGRKSSPVENSHQVSNMTVALLLATSLISLFLFAVPVRITWFLPYWFFFAGGIFCYWSLSKRISHWVFPTYLVSYALYLIAFTCLGLFAELGPAMIAGLVAILAIYFAGSKDHLTDWWNHPILQYLGRISYSLYLVHLVIIDIFLRLAFKLTGENEKMALVWIVFGLTVVIGFAHLLFIAIELPSMRLASRLKYVLPSPQNAITDKDDAVEENESGFASEATCECEQSPQLNN